MKCSTFFTKENISLCLSIISIIVTVGNFAHKLYTERVKLTVEAVGVWAHSNSHNLFLDLSITNNSRLPLSINRIELHLPSSSLTVRCVGNRKKFIETKTSGVTDNITYSQELPVYFYTLGSHRAWYQFKFPQPYTEQSLENSYLLVYCNNKKKKYPISITKPNS